MPTYQPLFLYIRGGRAALQSRSGVQSRSTGQDRFANNPNGLERSFRPSAGPRNAFLPIKDEDEVTLQMHAMTNTDPARDAPFADKRSFSIQCQNEQTQYHLHA